MLIKCFRLILLLVFLILAGESSSVAAGIPQSLWTLHYTDSEELVGEDGAATNSFDGDAATFWHTQWVGSPDPEPPHEIQINLGATYQISSFRYLPRQDGYINGTIKQYAFYVSSDGSNWGSAVATGFFATDTIEKEVVLAEEVIGNFIRLVALSEAENNAWTCVAEINVIGTSAAQNEAPDGVIVTPATDVTIGVGDAVDFTGSGSDPDDHTPLSYLWDFGSAGIADSTEQNPGPVVFDSAGTYTVTFTVTDAQGLPDPSPGIVTVSVVENQAPDGVIVTPATDVTIGVGDAVDFTGSGSDPDDHTPLSYLWDFGSAGIADSTEQNPGPVVFDSAGTYTVTFTVTDAQGLPDPSPGIVTVSVVENQAPDGVIVTPATDVTIGVGDAVDFTGSGSDPDDHTPLSYLWDFGSAGIADSTEQNPGPVVFDSAGTYTVTFTVTDAQGLPDPSPGIVTVSVVENQAPDGVIVTPATDVTIGVGDAVDFTGSGSDPDDHTPLSYLWDFGSAGIADSTEQNPGPVVFDSAGTYTVTFTVTDAQGLPDPSPGIVTVSVVENQAPDGVIVTPATDVTIGVGDAVDFTGSGSDPDDHTPLSYLWDFGSAGIADSTEQNPGPVVFDSAGTYTVTFTVTDAQGLPDPSPGIVTVSVVENQAPDGVIVTPATDVTIGVGDAVDFTGSGSDPDDHTPLSYLWDFGSAGIADSTEQNPGPVVFDSAGTYTVTFTVTDAQGLPDPSPGIVTVSVVENQAPDGVIVTPATDVTIGVGDAVDFTGSGSDPDDHTPLSYLWDFGSAGIADSTEQNPGPVVFDSAGTYTVTFTVTDAQGLPDPSPGVVEITVENSPTLIPQSLWTLHYTDSEELVGEDGAATNSFDGDAATFWHTQWVGSPDPEPPHEIQINLGATYQISSFRYLPRQDGYINGTIKQYAFYVSSDGSNWGSAVATGFFATDTIEKEVVLAEEVIGNFIRLVALSEAENNAWTCVAEINVIGTSAAQNEAPDGVIVTPATDVTIGVGDAVDFTGSGSDPDDHTPLSYLWDFGSAGIADSTEQNPGPVVFDSAGTYTVTFTVTDAQGLPDPSPGIVTVSVVENQAPDGVIVTPATDVTIGVGDAVDFTGSGSDPDDHTPLSYLWDFGSAGIADSTEQNPGPVVFDSAGTYTVTFTVTDAQGLPDPSPGIVTVSVVENQAPDGVIVTPATDVTIGVGDAVDFTGSGSDPDDHTPLSYLWDFGSAGIADSTEQNPGPVVFDSAGTYTVTFTVTDAQGLPDPSPGIVTVSVVENQAPDGVIVTPATDVTIGVGDAVDFTGSGSDPDDHTPLSYLWDFGSAGIADSTEQNPGPVVFDSAGTYTVTFTVTDAQGLPDPSPGVVEITVENSPTLIPQSLWTLHYTDSEELVGEDGAATNSFDGDAATFWHTQWVGSPDPEPPHEIQINLGATYQISSFRYLPRQDGYINGTIKQYAFYVSSDGSNWGSAVATGFFATDTIEKEVVLAEEVIGNFIRLVALSEAENNAWTCVAEINVIGTSAAQNEAPDGVIVTPATDVTIGVGDAVDFTGSGSDPDDHTPLSYLWDFGSAGIADSTEQNPGPVVFDSAGTYTVTFTVTDAQGLPDPSPGTVTVTVMDEVLSQTAWSLVYVDSEAVAGGNAEYAFDGDPETMWHTDYSAVPNPSHPHEIQIDLGGTYEIFGFRYLSSQPNGRIEEWEFFVSADGNGWGEPVASGTFLNTSSEKEVIFPKIEVRYVRLVALSEVNDNPWTSVAELNILGFPFGGNYSPNSTILSPSGNVVINVGGSVDFAGIGTDYDNNTPLSFLWDFGDGSNISDMEVESPGSIQFDTAGTFIVSLSVSDSLGRPDLTPDTVVVKVVDVTADHDIPQSGWHLVYADSEETVSEDGAAENSFDGDDSTIWHTQYSESFSPDYPHEIQIDFGGAYEIDAFRYLPRQDDSPNGRVYEYKIYISADGFNWGGPVAAGIFGNTSSEKCVLFPPKVGQFLRFVGIEEVAGNPWMVASEINAEGVCNVPYVKILFPSNYTVQPASDINVKASVCLNQSLYPGWAVKFLLDGGVDVGGQANIVGSAPYQTTFNGLAFSEHFIEVVIIDENGNDVDVGTTYDVVSPVGIGDYYVAIGDSITVGEGDDIPDDNNSLDGRNHDGGYTPILNDLMTQHFGYPHTIEMEGIAGSTSEEGLARLPEVLGKHKNANYFLIQYGTNDAGAFIPIDDGLGLYPGDDGYDGSFKDVIQQMIDLIVGDGKQVFLAQIPFSLYPTRNETIVLYNAVISELVADNGILVTPPEFYSYFEANNDQFSDSLHPNGEGYQGMANLWFNKLK